MRSTIYQTSAVSTADIRIRTRTEATVPSVFVSGTLVVRHVSLLFFPVMRNPSRTEFHRVLARPKHNGQIINLEVLTVCFQLLVNIYEKP